MLRIKTKLKKVVVNGENINPCEKLGISIEQYCSVMNNEYDLHVNGSVVLNRKVKQDEMTVIKIGANLCDRDGCVLYSLKEYGELCLTDESCIAAFSMYVSNVTRYVDIGELNHIEIYPMKKYFIKSNEDEL